MNARFRYSRGLIGGVVLGLALVAPALADPIGGDVPAINTLTPTYISNLSIVGANGLTSTAVVTGTIDNNDANGWDLRVVSTNLGKLIRAGGGGAGRELTYTNVTFAATGGTLGNGLTSPAATRNIVTGSGAGDVAGTTHFFTNTTFAGTGTATTATVGYAFELRITAAADTTLLSGAYSDTLTLTLNNDS